MQIDHAAYYEMYGDEQKFSNKEVGSFEVKKLSITLEADKDARKPVGYTKKKDNINISRQDLNELLEGALDKSMEKNLDKHLEKALKKRDEKTKKANEKQFETLTKPHIELLTQTQKDLKESTHYQINIFTYF